MSSSADARPHVTLVDGRSGSGKTSWALSLAQRTGARVLSLDEIYPGWDGLEAAEAHVISNVLVPLSTRRNGSYRTWDWSRHEPGEWRDVDASTPLIVEGCGALSPASRALADHGVWIELDRERRRSRAIARDGALFAREWERWARQEEWHARLHDPRACADEVVDGSLVRPSPSSVPEPCAGRRSAT
jgi:uridine kinase